MKIILVISNSLFYRNYLNHHVLDDLKKYADVKILGNKDHNDTKNLFDFVCSENPINAILHYIIATTLLFANIDKSKSFTMRVKRRYYPEIINKISFRPILKYIKKLLILIFYKCITSSTFVSKIFILILKKFLRINKSLVNIIDSEKPDLILIPTNGFYSFELDVEHTLHELDKKYISLIDNWDNLSSKTILIYKANHYGVWGEQNRIIAEKIQNINLDMTTSLGTPRYEVYRDTKIKKLFNFKYILYVGSSNKYNEFAVLKILNNVLIKRNINTKIVYRPHPWRDNDEFPALSTLSKVVLDPQMEKQYLSKKNSNDFQPELDYYTHLLGGSEFVIGGLTSMLIEAQLKKKHFVALIHKEPKFKYSPLEWYNGYTNFSELNSLKNLTFLRNLSDLEGVILKLLDSNSTFIEDHFISYFVKFDEEPYSKKLIKMIDDFKNK